MQRPCIEPHCDQLATTGAARCRPHQRNQGRAKNNRRATLAPTNGAAQQTRRALNRAGHAQCAHCRHTYPATHLEIDHIIRLADGGTDTRGNTQILCRPCHQTKSNTEQHQARTTTH